MNDLKTTKDIVIPAGSKVYTGWNFSLISEHCDVLVDLHPDCSGRLVMDRNEAEELGIIKKDD